MKIASKRKLGWIAFGGLVVLVAVNLCAIMKSTPAAHFYKVWRTDVAYAKAIGDARARHRGFANFERMFPGSYSYIEYFSGEAGEPVLCSVAGVGDRFVVTLKIPLAMHPQTRRIENFGDPRVLIQEVMEVQVRTDGRVEVRYSPRAWEPSPEEWQYVDAAGDLGVLGIPVEGASPVPEFRRALSP